LGKKTVTIEGDTSGTWLTTNGKGISLVFALSTGSTFLATANSWNASTSYGVTGQTQILATNSATWQVTGVQLEADTSASDFEFLPYDVNLQRCERYYQLLQGFEGSMRTSVGFGCTTMFRTQMRSAPSVTQSGALQITDGNADFTQSSTSVSIPASRVTTLGVQLYFVNFSGLTQFRPAGQNTNVNDSKVGADAEL
jgi:hypothetical protein